MSLPPVSSPWFRRLLYGSVTLVILLAVWYFGFRAPPPAASSRSSWGSRGTQAMPVKVVVAQRQPLSVHLKSIGTVVPMNTVTVRSRVEGQLLRVTFEEGQRVEKGQLLAEIDPSTYQIRLSQAEGQQRQNLAQVQTARSDLQRYEQLFEKNLLTLQELELQQALVAEREGALASFQAQVDTARLQLSYTRIEAPIAGRLGLRQVDAGNLIRAGEAGGLVVITQTQPISVLFTVPEVDLQKVLEPLRAGEVLVVEAWDRSEQLRLASGVLKTVDNQIDVATGTLRLKAEFANEDERLFPNQFVNVRLRVSTVPDALVIPSAAVQYGSRGTYVYIVNAENKSVVRDLVLGPADGLLQSVTKGLQAGDQVVLEGLDRLREGRSVIVVTGDSAPAPPPASPSNRTPRGK
ncbi:MAG: MdtA/MuxA family multidrug efflux RND transporter periplasmic adaptor subunit [Opitutaceae bacterium]|nr:MdtA/MuxA family multidrug efflux RND transporter periplasmic adaptor subunit [Opitutaceae bacterium]